MQVVVGLIASVLVWLFFLRSYDKFEPEPFGALLKVLVLGGVLSIVPVYYLSEFYSYIPADSYFLYALVVGFNEEFFKLLATVILIRKMKDFNEPIDAMIYSMTVALGFAGLENVLYVSRMGSDILLIRALMPMPAHLADAAIWGYGLSVYYFKPRKKGLVATVLPYYIASAFAHAAYDFPLFSDYISIYSTMAVLLIVCALAHVSLKELLKDSQFAKFGVCTDCSPEEEAPAATEEEENAKKKKKKEHFICNSCGKVYSNCEES